MAADTVAAPQAVKRTYSMAASRRASADEWMRELRERELQKRRLLASSSNSDGAAEDMDKSCRTVRITSDDEEMRSLEGRAPALGAAVRRCSLAHAVANAARLRGSRVSLTAASTPSSGAELMPALPQHPPPDPPQPVPERRNTGKEPPVLGVVEGLPGATPPQNDEGTVVRQQKPRRAPPPALHPQEQQPSLPAAVPDTEVSEDITSPVGPGLAGTSAPKYLIASAEEDGHGASPRMRKWRNNLKVWANTWVAASAACAVLTAAAVVLEALVNGANWLVVVVPILCLLQAAIAFSLLPTRKQQAELAGMDQQLLLSLLPADVVAQMFEGVRCIAVHHDSLTFCFCDLVGFTKASGRLHPGKLVAGLNTLITLFDDIAQKMGITKVKTMGDAYMAVCGFRQPADLDHVKQMVLWGMRMVRTLRTLWVEELDMRGVNVRMGVATGPAVSGILGETKPVYDFWGNTVNMASRMESNSQKNRINCTQQVRDHLVERGFTFTVQSDVYIKGKGRMDTYMVIDALAPVADSAAELPPGSPRKGAETSVERFAQEIDQLASIQSEKGFHNDIRQVLFAVSALTEELELQKATQLVVRTVRELLRCDRATLFMVDEEARQLWSFHNLDSKGRRIRMPMDKGLAGWAAIHCETVNISDAYEDPRFNKEVDVITGYRTRNLLCYPVVRGDTVIAVIQAVNKKHGKFNEEDTLMIALLGRQAGIHLMHGQMYEELRQSELRAYILFQVSRDLNTKILPADIFESVTTGAQRFMMCDRATLFVCDHQRRELYSLDTSSTGEFSTVAIPIGQGIVGHVAVVGEITNIADVYRVPMFDPSYDQQSGYRTKSVLCAPIVDTTKESAYSTGYVLGVLEVINKLQPEDITSQNLGRGEPIPFAKEDEEYMQSFASFVAVTIRNAMLHEQNKLQEEHGRLLLELSMVSTAAESYEALISLLQRRIPLAINCEACQLFVQQPDGAVHAWPPQGKQQLRLGAGDLAACSGLVGEVVLGRIAQYNTVREPTRNSNNDMLQDPRCNPAIDNIRQLPKVAQCLILPLTYDAHTVGAIQVFNKCSLAAGTQTILASAGQVGELCFDGGDEAFLSELADVAAVHLICHQRQAERLTTGQVGGGNFDGIPVPQPTEA